MSQLNTRHLIAYLKLMMDFFKALLPTFSAFIAYLAFGSFNKNHFIKTGLST